MRAPDQLTHDASTVYARARKLVATLQYQLQQLEDAAAGASDADSCSAATENLSRLFADVALLDRVVQDTTADQKRELWRKCVAAACALCARVRPSPTRPPSSPDAPRNSAPTPRRCALLWSDI